jgi:DNA-binding NarL/FixJ family response regulator
MTSYLGSQPDITILGETSLPETALAMVKEMQPDITLVDIDLGGQDGLHLAQQLRAINPAGAVVVLSASDSEEQMRRALEIGAAGYLVKDIAPESLVKALHRVMEGEMVFSRSFLLNQARSSLRPPAPAAAAAALSDREREVLGLVAEGLMDKQIASRFGISENTVKNHLKNIRQKLGALNRVQACLIALEQGMIDRQQKPNPNAPE